MTNKERMDRINDCIMYLIDTYKEEIFEPKDDFAKEMMSMIIKHEALERNNLLLFDIEVSFIQKQIKLLKNS